MVNLDSSWHLLILWRAESIADREFFIEVPPRETDASIVEVQLLDTARDNSPLWISVGKLDDAIIDALRQYRDDPRFKGTTP